MKWASDMYGFSVAATFVSMPPASCEFALSPERCPFIFSNGFL